MKSFKEFLKNNIKKLNEDVKDDGSKHRSVDTVSLEEMKSMFTGNCCSALMDDLMIDYPQLQMFVDNPQFSELAKWFIDHREKLGELYDQEYKDSIIETFPHFSKSLQIYCFDKIPQLIEKILSLYNLPFEVQDYYLNRNITLIGKIRNLDPKLKEKHSVANKGAEAGFF